jgi:beta-glucanase (GH16 family)
METPGTPTSTGGTPAAGGQPSGGTVVASGGLSTGGKATGGTATGGSTAAGGSTSPGCTSTSSGWNLVWSDEFNGLSGTAVDGAKWTFDVGGTGWGNSELEYYTSGTNNASMDGAGNLVITAKQQSQGGMNYTSARIKTQGLATWTYGRIEARLKLPQGQGIWPAFWLLGSDITTNSWPACGEIDVMENIGKEPNIIHGTIHGPGYSGGSGPTGQITLSAPVASAFHVYAIEWEQNVIRWYVDDTLYSTKTPSNIPSGATWVYAHPFFIILNVAVGGTWPGNPDSTTVFPQQMLVDYVRVCQK